MFTGIIDHCGTILKMEIIPDGMRLAIRHSFRDLDLGESIAVDGICLTVTHFQNDIFYCDISPETLEVTTAKFFAIGQPINLERALQLTSRLGGHFVMGHVDQVAIVKSIKTINDFIEMTFANLDTQFIIKKGSITINGVSLTVNELTEDGCKVMLIPHTLERTDLTQLQEGDAVNIEFDMLVRIVVEKQRAYL